MTLLTISTTTWSWAQYIGPILCVIPAAISIWWCSRIDLRRQAVWPIAVTIYVGLNLVLHFILQAIHAARIIAIS